MRGRSSSSLFAAARPTAFPPTSSSSRSKPQTEPTPKWRTYRRFISLNGRSLGHDGVTLGHLQMARQAHGIVRGSGGSHGPDQGGGFDEDAHRVAVPYRVVSVQ